MNSKQQSAPAQDAEPFQPVMAEDVVDEETGTVAIYDPDDDAKSPGSWISASADTAVYRGEMR